MPVWVRYGIMSTVFGLWLLFMGPTCYEAVFDHGPPPPLSLWSIPIATYAILSGRRIHIGSDGVRLGEEEIEPSKQEEHDNGA